MSMRDINFEAFCAAFSIGIPLPKKPEMNLNSSVFESTSFSYTPKAIKTGCVKDDEWETLSMFSNSPGHWKYWYQIFHKHHPLSKEAIEMM
jgi:hypothetical protein